MSQGAYKTERRALLGHQEAFIEQFFAKESEQVFFLRSDLGLGTSFTVAHLVQRCMSQLPAGRILILSPKALGPQLKNELLDLGVNAEIVDRYRYRELQGSEAKDGMPWPAGTVFVLSLDFAQQADITASLASVPWSLFVVKEAHHLKGLKAQLLEKIVASSPYLRILLLSATGEKSMSVVGMPPPVVVDWKASEIASANLLVKMPTSFEAREYQEDLAEQQVGRLVNELVCLLEGRSRFSLHERILQALASSPAALEESLAGLRNQLARGNFKIFESSSTVELPRIAETSSKEMLLDEPVVYDAALGADMVNMVEKVFAQLETMPIDTKLSAFVQVLTKTLASGLAPTCIVTDSRATLFYLQIQLEDMGLKPSILSDSVAFDDQIKLVQEFNRQGGLLLATGGAVLGLSLELVEVLFLYDLPSDAQKFHELYGRFQRYGRQVPLTANVFCSTMNRDLVLESLNNLKMVCNGLI